MSPIPDIPGELVHPNSDQGLWLKAQVARLCHLDNDRFPGSQPISFGERNLADLENDDFWVCEKSDGIRVLLLILTNPETQEVIICLIDRHNTYRKVDGFYFPHFEKPEIPIRSTLLDGELVLDVDPVTKTETLRYLAFDCMVVDDQYIMNKPLDKRYGRLSDWFYKPYVTMLRDHPEMVNLQPFHIQVKKMHAAYQVSQVFDEDIPKLQHGNDGLIYTKVEAPYTPNTDRNILKWKPPSENSIDFKLVVRFPPSPSNPGLPDFFAKPVFALHAWYGDERGMSKYELYDQLYVTDEEWESLKESGVQVDDRIVEVHWDSELQKWRMMRFRDDKPNGNHISVVENIIRSIADGVEKDALLSRTQRIRHTWKERQARPKPAVARPAAPRPAAPSAVIRYGPLASSPWSKVGGPAVIAGMKR
ncbi:mRNA capping enzyme, catalytic domain-containing protein [Schizophyllum commune]